jgi:chromosome segregation ATPase
MGTGRTKGKGAFMSDQTNLAELERRITTALARIGAGLDKLDAMPDVAPEPEPPAQDRALLVEVTALKAALAREKAQVAQMAERLKSAGHRETLTEAQLEAKVEKMTQQLDIQGLELQRMRKSTVQLREHLRVLHEAAASATTEPQLINKALQAELDSLRATRHAEVAEMDEILAELKPMIEEVRANG